MDNPAEAHDIDVQFGVAGFASFAGRHGDTGDGAYRWYRDLTFDAAALMDAADRLGTPLLSGGGEPESQQGALYRVVREVGWRDGALRVVAQATDAKFHDLGTDPGYPDTGRTAALNDLGRAPFSDDWPLPMGGPAGTMSAVREKGAVRRRF